MSKVEQLEAAMSNLTVDELQEIRDWLENFLEDELELTDEFKAQIEQAERDMAEGRYSRIRRPGPNT